MKTLLAILTNPVNSEKFISYSTSMAGDLDYKLHIIYVQNPALYTISSEPSTNTPHPVEHDLDVKMLETDRNHTLKSIKEKLAGLKDISKTRSIDISAEAGTMNMVINSYISRKKADMVVLEGDDDGGLFMSGLDIINKINCPGWIIPSKMSYKPYKKIVYATDYKEADIITLKKLIALTENLSPEIIALHITDSEDFKEKTMQKGFKDMLTRATDYERIQVKVEKEDKNFEETINETAINTNADLLVLLKENKGFIEKIFTSSSTKKVIKKAELPVLVYHEYD